MLSLQQPSDEFSGQHHKFSDIWVGQYCEIAVNFRYNPSLLGLTKLVELTFVHVFFCLICDLNR